MSCTATSAALSKAWSASRRDKARRSTGNAETRTSWYASCPPSNGVLRSGFTVLKPGVVGKCLVRLGHPVHLVALGDRGTFVVVGGLQFGCQALFHWDTLG